MSAADRAAFLRAIAENPDDDLPRLVYADWLDEHGEPERAEFIRVQCELFRMPSDHPRREGLEVRVRELYAAHEATWRPAPPPGVTVDSLMRGFVHVVTFDDYAAFARIAEPLFAANPIYQLRASGLRMGQLRALVRLPFLSTVRALALSTTPMGNNVVTVLAKSASFTSLDKLNLANNWIGDIGAQQLAEENTFSSLRVLDLAYNRIGDTGAEALAASALLPHLTALNLRGNPIGPEGQALLRARFGPAVKL